mmetsp:Transcript_7695/g.13231  ORF Transcript_7695/g.13231 Transcript_7695/m.13231 type:complete len:170 (+) Transcript_7695:339-848(+)
MSSDKWLNLLGLGGGTLMSIMMIPQLWQVYKTKSAKDLAWGFLINYFVGISMLCSFSFGKGLWSLYIPQSLEVVMVLLQILMKLRYDRRASIGNEENALESILIDNRVHIAPRATATQNQREPHHAAPLAVAPLSLWPKTWPSGNAYYQPYDTKLSYTVLCDVAQQSVS